MRAISAAEVWLNKERDSGWPRPWSPVLPTWKPWTVYTRRSSQESNNRGRFHVSRLLVFIHINLFLPSLQLLSSREKMILFVTFFFFFSERKRRRNNKTKISCREREREFGRTIEKRKRECLFYFSVLDYIHYSQLCLFRWYTESWLVHYSRKLSTERENCWPFPIERPTETLE